jgi:hypothetical protein
VRDENKTLRDFLLTNAALVVLVGARVYAGIDMPAEGYKPSVGGAITFRARGGAVDYSDALLDPSMQFKCYGETPALARAVYAALYDALHQARGGLVRHAWCDVIGQDLLEPETGWPFVLAYFTVRISNA